MRMRNKNEPDDRTRGRAMPWRLILTSVEVSLELLLYLLCEKHEGSLSEKGTSRAPTAPTYVKIMVPSCAVRELE